MAKLSETLSADEFRDRARKEYEDRRAEGRLRLARTTCVNLDAKADIKVCGHPIKRQTSFVWISVLRLVFPLAQFNRFWLDPENPESFPPGLLEALEELLSSSSSGIHDPGPSDIAKTGQGMGSDAGTAARLKAQMQADALRPLNSDSAGSDDGEDGERPLRTGTGVDSDQRDVAETVPVWPEETLIEVGNYLRLSVSRFQLPQPPAPVPFSRNIISPPG